MQSFPSNEEFHIFTRTLNGSTVTIRDAAYANASSMYNLRVLAYPYSVTYVSSVEDIQKVRILSLKKKKSARLSLFLT